MSLSKGMKEIREVRRREVMAFKIVSAIFKEQPIKSFKDRIEFWLRPGQLGS